MEAMIIGQDSFENPDWFGEPDSILFFTKKSIDKTTPNEDALGVFPMGDGNYVFAVADGAGGYPKGEEAAQVCLHHLHKALKDAEKRTSYRIEILDAIESANQELTSNGVGSKSTLTIFEYTQGICRSYQVGDSTSLICTSRGNLKFRSTAHSPVGYGLESGMLTEKEAIVHPDLHYISNLVGQADMKIELGPPISIGKQDRLFLASDGVFDNFEAEIIVETIRKGSLSQVAKELMALIQTEVYENPNAKQDDLSFIVFQP